MNIYMLIAQTQGSLAAMSLPSRQEKVFFEEFINNKKQDLKILTSRVPQRNSPARPDFNKAYNQPHPYVCMCLVV